MNCTGVDAEGRDAEYHILWRQVCFLKYMWPSFNQLRNLTMISGHDIGPITATWFKNCEWISFEEMMRGENIYLCTMTYTWKGVIFMIFYKTLAPNIKK